MTKEILKEEKLDQVAGGYHVVFMSTDKQNQQDNLQPLIAGIYPPRKLLNPDD